MTANATEFGKKNRIDIIDAVRGICILLMLVYHLHVDFYMLGIISRDVLYNPVFNFLQLFFACLFILMSGISSRLSHSNLRRGLLMLGAGMVVTIATYIFNPEYFVKFGILHFMGLAALIFWALHELIDKIPRVIQPFLWAGGFAASYVVIYAKTFDVQYLGWLGFRSATYASSDYFPVIPFIFVYLFGTWLGTLVTEHKMPRWFYCFKCAPMAFVGRNTIWVYLAHQPICMALAYLVLWITTRA